MISKSEIKALAEADEQEVVAEVQVSPRWDLSGHLFGGGIVLAEVTLHLCVILNLWKGDNIWLQLLGLY